MASASEQGPAGATAGSSSSAEPRPNGTGAEIEHTKHLFRAFFVLALAVFAGIVARWLLLPATFGVAGHYRLASVDQYKAKPLIHGGVTACRECHLKQWNAHAAGKHATVGCEVCHLPTPVPHATGGTKTADAAIDRSDWSCLVCHQKLEARPKAFPQVARAEHLGKWMKGMKAERVAAIACQECHNDPHGLE
jgi:hypothetical protein